MHGESRLLAPFGDANGFARIGVELTGDAARISRLRRNARLAGERIDWGSVNDAFAAAPASYAILPTPSVSGQ